VKVPSATPPEDPGSFEPGGYVADPPLPSWSYRPLQSLVRQRCSRLTGLPAPGTIFTFAETRDPSGLPSAVHAQGSDSLGYSLMGFGPPSRFVPKSRPWHLGHEHLSWGFLSLQRSRKQESTARLLPDELPGCPGFHPPVPPGRLRCRSQVFPTSQRLLPPATTLPFSDRWRSWDSPFRGLLLSRSLDGSSPPKCPPDVPPTGCACPS
jgi:hypothetical protein